MIQTKAAIYARVSTEMQHVKGYSLPEQEAICRKYGAERSYEITGLYQDDISGATFDRPGMNRILEAAKRGEINRVLVQELDRFARDATALLILEHQLKLYEVQVDYILNNFQPGAVGDFHKTIAIGVAQLEREMIRLRTMRGRVSKAKQGKVVSGARLPYGYYFKDNMYYINEEEATIVRLIFSWYVHEKLGVVAIARRLSEMKVLTRGDKEGRPRKRGAGVWGASTIIHMIRNETYAGRYVYNRQEYNKNRTSIDRDPSEWIYVEVPIIIEEPLFQAAQTQRLLNTTVANPRNRKREYLLAGMLTCSTCGKRLVGMSSANRPNKYYRCGDQIPSRSIDFKKDHLCRSFGYLNVDKIDTLVWLAVVKVIKNPDLILEAISQKQDEQSSESLTLQAHISLLESKLDEVKDQEKKLLELFLSSSLGKELLEDKAEDLKKTREGLVSQLAVFKERVEVALIDDSAAREIVTACEVISAGLDLLDFEERRSVLQLLRLQVFVDRDKQTLTLSGLVPSLVLDVSVLSHLNKKRWYKTLTL